MANEQYKDQKKPLRFSKKQIDKAAREIRHGIEDAERLKAIEKIQNFREFHLYPLMLMKNHLVRTAKKVSPKVLVARRLKRLPTILNKLERPTLDGKKENSIKLTRMQDIAGCRAILRDKTELLELRKKLNNSRSVHQIIREKDYLTHPKSSGYGGLHLIYSCYEGQEEIHKWKGAKVEVQLRTKLQHAWATSLEIIDTLEDIELKTSTYGYTKWREFFEIAGKLVAHEEEWCLIDDLKELRRLILRVDHLAEELNVSKKLSGYSIAINFSSMKVNNLPKAKRNDRGLFLIKVPRQQETGKRLSVQVQFFNRNESDQAIKSLNEAEMDPKHSICVLAAAEGARALKQAYPNYFGSTRLFTDFLFKQKERVNKYLREDAEKIINLADQKTSKGQALASDHKLSIEKLKKLLNK